MEIRYTLLDPTKNMTVLVETAMDRGLYARAARELLSSIPEAEQVGWLEPASTPGCWGRLQMMGDEFCGNATMATASLLASRRGLRSGETADVPLEVSGAEGPLTCRVLGEADGSFRGTVRLPLPERLSEQDFDLRGERLRLPVVELPGITHVLVPEEKLSRTEAERLIRPWGESFDAEAVGILLLRGEEMTPLVLVKPTDSAVWERGCGSGSAAVGAWNARRTGGEAVTEVRQPGGVITVQAAWDGERVSSLAITGTIRVEKQGVASVLE